MTSTRQPFSSHVEYATHAAPHSLAADDANTLVPIKIEKMYEMAALEADSGRSVRWMMAKAFSDADGNEGRAKAIYIRLRVQDLKMRQGMSGAIDYGRNEHAMQLTHLREENHRLKRLVADQALELQLLQEKSRSS